MTSTSLLFDGKDPQEIMVGKYEWVPYPDRDHKDVATIILLLNHHPSQFSSGKYDRFYQITTWLVLTQFLPPSIQSILYD